MNEHHYKSATVFGGTGFIGRQVVRELAQLGYTVKIATRMPESAYALRVCGRPGQIVPVAVDYKDAASIAAVVAGSSLVVNCIGILRERRRGDFIRLHARVPEMIAQACAAQGHTPHNAPRFVHISSLAAGVARSRYARSKEEGERAVHAAFPAAVILRPSVVFGAGDRFFNLFAEIARYVPVLPLIGGGRTKMQPVFVGDVADAVVAAGTLVPVGDFDVRGRVFALGGPEIIDFKDVYARIFALTGRKRRLVKLPWFIAKIQAAFMALLPAPLLTPDQVETLRADNIVPPEAAGLAQLGIIPTGMNVILPTYLTHYAAGGRFADKRAA